VTSLCFLTEWEAVVVEVMVKEALEVAEVATVVEEEEVATVVVVVEAMVMLPQGTLVEDSRCTIYKHNKHVVQCSVRPTYMVLHSVPLCTAPLFNTVRITYMNALRTLAHETRA
jgi:hypothetical protein